MNPFQILLIDDNPQDRALVERELRRQFPDCVVSGIGTDRDLSQALKYNSPDLVISDYHMPWADGLEIFRRIRGQIPACPVIIYSGSGNEKIAAEALSAGVDDYVVKSSDRLPQLMMSARLALERNWQRKAALRAEDRFQNLFQTLPIGMLFIAPGGYLVDANPRMVSMLGYPDRASLLSLGRIKFFENDEAEADFHRRLREKKSLEGYETRLRRKDGSLLWCRFLVHPVHSEEGEPLYFELVVEDIQARREAEDALRLNESRLGLVYDSVSDMLMLLHVESEDSFRVVMVNQAVVKNTGHTAESMIGHTTREFLSDPVFRITNEKFRQALRSRKSLRFLLSTRPQGRVRLCMEAILTPISDSGGTGRHLLVVARDITARLTSEREIRRVMRELRDSERRYRTLAEAANDQIFILDRDIRIAYVNSLASKLLQRPVSEIVGQTMPSLFPPAIAERQAASVRSVFDLGQPSYHEELSANPEGDIWLGTWLVPLRDSSGRITSVLGVARDISARVKSEQALRESEVRFRAIFEKAAFGIVLIGLDGRLLECNETICEMLEMPHDKLARQSLELITLAEDRSVETALIEAAARNGKETFQQELRLLRKNEIPVWCRLTVSAALSAGLETVFLIGMVEDISKRLEVEQANRQAGESLRRYADRLETLHEIDRAILESHSQEEIAGATLERIHRLMPCQRSVLVLFDMQARTAAVLDEYPPMDSGSIKRTPIPLTDYGSELEILQAGELFSVEDMLDMDSPCLHHQRLLAAGVRTYLSLPLMSRGALIGALTIGSGSPAAFTREHSEIAAEVADLLAVAIEQARLFQQVRQHTFELESVAAFYQDLRQAPGRHEISEVVVRHTGRILQSECVALLEFDPANECYSVESASASSGLLVGKRIPIRNAFTRDVFSTGKPYIENHLQDNARGDYAELLRPLRSTACAPMFSRGFAVGAIWIGRSRRANSADFTAADLQLLESLGEVGGSAMHRAALFEQTEQRLRRLSALRAVDMAISASIDLRVTLAVLLDQVATQLQVDAAIVRILNVPSQTLNYLAGRGIQSPAVTQTPLQLGQGFAGAAALKRRVIRVPQFATEGDDYARSLRESGEPFASYFVAPLLSKGNVKGVLELFSRKFFEPDEEWAEYLETMAAQAAIAIDNASLFDDLQRTNTDLITAYDATIEGWSRALELRDRETEGHTLRVTDITLRLARRVGIQEDEMIHIRRGALMHDIGKMGVSDAILLKPGPLTPEEMQVMRRHPVFAYEMLYPIGYLRSAIDIPYCHHEKWDGSGYPRGLKGEQIPLAARVFAIIDVWDALRNDRPYRKAWPESKVRTYLREQSGRHFDPAVVEAFLKIVDEEI